MEKNLVIIFGGRSCEHDISIITALYTYNAVELKGYKKILVYFKDGQFYIGKNLVDIESYIKFQPTKYQKVIFNKGKLYKLKNKKITELFKVDCALLCTHGGEGENGILQGHLGINDIPYTSSDVSASSLTMDKVLTKKVLEAYGYQVIPYMVYKKDDRISPVDVQEKLSFPVIIKPSKLGSSIGISVANDEEELIRAIELGFKYDEKLLIEQCLRKFLEVNCGALRKDSKILVSMTERIIFENDYLTYDDKYLSNIKLQNNRECPANIEKTLLEKVTRLTKKLYEDFELSGVIRVDFLITEKEVFVNEINAIPGSLSFYLFSQLGIDMSQLVLAMVKQAKADESSRKQLITNFASEIISHYKSSGGCIKK